MKRETKSFYSPLIAGIGLGLTLLTMLLLTGHGIGAYGFFRNIVVELSTLLAPNWAEHNVFIGTFLKKYHGFWQAWISWEIIGVAIGALGASLWFGRFKLTIERGKTLPIPSRLMYAFGGGLLAGFGAALAKGCTSGLGLSGGATLVVGAFIFLGAFFITGSVLSLYTRRLWQ